MIEYVLIFCIAVAQYLTYLAIDGHNIRFPKWLLLPILLVAQLLIFPRLLFWAYDFEENKCGMPILALHLFFFLLGGSLNIITHLVYYFKSRSKKTV